MSRIIHKTFQLYKAGGGKVLAYENVRNVYSERSHDSEPEVIQQMVSYQLKDGTALNRIDDTHFESISGETFTLHKPE
jgi:hypothetical protein